MTYWLLGVGLVFTIGGIRDVIHSDIQIEGRYTDRIETMRGSYFILALIQVLAGLTLLIFGIIDYFDLAYVPTDTERLILYIGAGTFAGTLFIGMMIRLITPPK